MTSYNSRIDADAYAPVMLQTLREENMNFKMKLFMVLSLLLLSGCITTRSISSKSLVFNSAQDIYLHENSGFSFPAKIENFRRDKDIKFFDEAGNNFSVPYNLDTQNEKAIGTIYVYPSLKDYNVFPIPKLGQTPEYFLKEQYEGAKKSIIERYQARVISENEVRINRSMLNPSGRKGIFEYDAVNGETVTSQLYLFAHKGWLVKYRFTYPSKFEAVVAPQLERFVDSFHWP